MKFNAAVLKSIAIISMITDHIAVLLWKYGLPEWGYNIMRSIGRLAFPIFCFLLVEGFINTKSFCRYLTRMVGVAVLSQIPYNLLAYGSIIGGRFNVLFTFSVTLLVLYILSKCDIKKIWGIIGVGIAVMAGIFITYGLNFEYSYKCILLAVVFYYSGKKFENSVFKFVAAAAILATNSGMIELFALVSLIFINAYDGEKGKFPKWFGYGFYPLHLLVLGLIKYCF